MIKNADFDGVIIGGGLIGLAIARAIKQKLRNVLLVEKSDRLGSGITSRNSEVIHAGVYYRPDSLKARLCVLGKHMLYDFAEKKKVAHRRIGKWVVATDPQQSARLLDIFQIARENGVKDIRLESASYFKSQCSDLNASTGLISDSTGIIDVHGLVRAIQMDFEDMGGIVGLRTEFVRAEKTISGFHIELASNDGITTVVSERLINASGLAAPAVAARIDGLHKEQIPIPRYAKGTYFNYTGKVPFEKLVYPVPVDGGLGIHLTYDLQGQARFGPDVQWIDGADDFRVDEARKEQFAEAIRTYWPACETERLTPAYAGIRPKIASQHGQINTDFVIQKEELGGLVNLFGIESPGITACLAIGEYVRNILL